MRKKKKKESDTKLRIIPKEPNNLPTTATTMHDTTLLISHTCSIAFSIIISLFFSVVNGKGKIYSIASFFSCFLGLVLWPGLGDLFV